MRTFLCVQTMITCYFYFWPGLGDLPLPTGSCTAEGTSEAIRNLLIYFLTVFVRDHYNAIPLQTVRIHSSMTYDTAREVAGRCRLTPFLTTDVTMYCTIPTWQEQARGSDPFDGAEFRLL